MLTVTAGVHAKIGPVQHGGAVVHAEDGEGAVEAATMIDVDVSGKRITIIVNIGEHRRLDHMRIVGEVRFNVLVKVTSSLLTERSPPPRGRIGSASESNVRPLGQSYIYGTDRTAG